MVDEYSQENQCYLHVKFDLIFRLENIITSLYL